MKRSPLVELFWKIHVPVYRASGGRLLGRLVGMPVLLLTTRGRKSGQVRTTALTFVHNAATDPPSYVVIGSLLGEPRHPGWVHNLRAEPLAEVEIGRRRERVRAREAAGEERRELWKLVIDSNPDYAQYEHRSDREIPVVVLEPLGDGDASKGSDGSKGGAA